MGTTAAKEPAMTTISTDRAATEGAAAPPVTAEGINGRITVNGDRILLRKGLSKLRSGIRGERLVQPSQIASVQLHSATDQTDGRFRLVMQGEDPNEEVHGDGEYIIRFHPTSAPSFERVRERVEALL